MNTYTPSGIWVAKHNLREEIEKSSLTYFTTELIKGIPIELLVQKLLYSYFL